MMLYHYEGLKQTKNDTPSSHHNQTNINKIRYILEYNKYYYIFENSKELKISNLQEDIQDVKDIKNGKITLIK